MEAQPIRLLAVTDAGETKNGVEYGILLPALVGGGRAAGRINRFYAVLRRRFLRKLRMLRTDAPTQVMLRYDVTHNDGAVLSIVREVRVRRGGCTESRRRADVWDLRTGWPMGLQELFPQSADIVQSAAQQIARRLGVPPYSVAFRRVRRPAAVRRRMREDGFYVRDGWVTVFFNPGVLAPEEAGSMEFRIFAES